MTITPNEVEWFSITITSIASRIVHTISWVQETKPYHLCITISLLQKTLPYLLCKRHYHISHEWQESMFQEIKRMQEVIRFLLDWMHYHICEIPYSFQCIRTFLDAKNLCSSFKSWNHNETISSIHYVARKANIHYKFPMILVHKLLP